MASESSSNRELQSKIAERINRLAESIASEVASGVVGGGALAPQRFKCTDYACEGAEFTCSKFRCGNGFKVAAFADVSSSA